MSFEVFMDKAVAFIMSIILTLVPYAGIEMPGLSVKEEDCLLNIELISDTHVENNGFFRQGFLKQGFRTMSRSKSPIDAVVVTGDLTNYADEPALAQYFELCKEYSPAPVLSVAGNHDIGHAGDRDVTDISREQALANYIKYRNQYMGTDSDVNYCAFDIKGYKFIILGDEVVDGGHWDDISMTPEQLEFLDSQLAEGTKDGKPAFVCCHWPVDHRNGEDTIWDGSGISDDMYPVREILEKYDNVFYLSGHMHAGIKSTLVEEKYGLTNAEKVDKVTYLNLPTYGIVNMFGLTHSGTGAQLEVYKDKVIFRPVNYLTGNWYTNSAYVFGLM